MGKPKLPTTSSQTSILLCSSIISRQISSTQHGDGVGDFQASFRISAFWFPSIEATRCSDDDSNLDFPVQPCLSCFQFMYKYPGAS